MIPFLKKWFGDLRSCSQGGIRNASATVFYPIWHLQFDDLIVLKNNQGTEETRVRHMDYGVVLMRSSGDVSRTKKTSHSLTPIKCLTFMKPFIKTLLLFEELYVKYEKDAASVRKRWLRKKCSKVVFSRNEPILDVSI
jgi:ribonucleoside-diphosphate reductase alpha chain